jgi:uncharacterized protein with HEPN domain
LSKDKRHYSLFFEDTIDAMNKIESYIKDLDYNSFCQNNMIIDAVVRNLEIIGEAIKNIPENIITNYPEIPWKRMIGLRNIVIHAYFGIDLENIWKIITENIPEVKPEIIQILNNLKNEENKE